MNLKFWSNVTKFGGPFSLAIVIGLFVYFVIQITAATELREEAIEIKALTNELQYKNDKRIKLIQVYTITQDEKIFRQYEETLGSKENLKAELEKIGEIGLSGTEQKMVKELLEILEKLMVLEDAALKAAEWKTEGSQFFDFFGTGKIVQIISVLR